MSAANLAELMLNFEKSLRQFLISNADGLKYTHSQYAMRKISEGEYEIELSITGLGTQLFTVKMVGDEFMFRGKMAVVGTSQAFPMNTMTDLLNGALVFWFSQSVETMVAAKAKDAIEKAQDEVGHPVNAIVKLLPPGTTTNDAHEVEPVKEMEVSVSK